MAACAPPPPPSFEGSSSEIRAYLDQLEEWAIANEADANRDAIRFWSLKIPAILVSASSGILVSLHTPVVVAALIGTVGSICIALDGIVRPGKQRSVHLRAVHDLRNLENAIRNRWDILSLKIRTAEAHGKELSGYELAHVTMQILENAEKERTRIAKYLASEETSTLENTKLK